MKFIDVKITYISYNYFTIINYNITINSNYYIILHKTISFFGFICYNIIVVYF